MTCAEFAILTNRDPALATRAEIAAAIRHGRVCQSCRTTLGAARKRFATNNPAGMVACTVKARMIVAKYILVDDPEAKP